MTGPDPASDPRIGQRLSHFRVDAKLGEGGMGVVYRATDERLRREVALKVLPDALASDPERKRRFLREARAAAAVSHPNIAAVYDIGEADGHAFIAMELIHGDTLRARMEPGLTRTEALRIAREIARGLAEAHEKGIVHRDLKPENVMIRPDGGVRILDFGLAKVLDVETGASGTGATASQTAEGRVMGTPPYMSPEQADGAAEIDARSDVFSFGTMLYEMLSGVRPFDGKTRVAVLYAVLHGHPEALETACPSVPGALAAVVARCLKKAKEERFASGRELLAALDGDDGMTAEVSSGKALAAARVSTVSGMGTALRATALANAAEVAATAARTQGSGTSGRQVWAWATMVVAAAAAAGFIWSKPDRPPRVATPAPSTSAAAPLRCNPEATQLFDAGVEIWETRSTNDAADVFERAVQADPDCAPAELRLAWFPGGHPESVARNHLANARAHRERLTDAEGVILDMLTRGLLAAQPSPAAGYEELRAAALRFPDDPMIEFAYASAAPGRGKLAEATAALERVLVLRPKFGPAYGTLAQWATSKQDRERYLGRCARAVPRHVWCDTMQAESLANGHDCPALERFGRDVVARNPGRQASAVLLSGLAANGASKETLDEAFRQVAGVSDGAAIPRHLAALEADYAGLERLLRGDPRAIDGDLKPRAEWASELALVLDDTGREAEASKLVLQAVRAAPALVPPRERVELVNFYARAIAAGALTRAEVDAALGPAPVTTDASEAYGSWQDRQLVLALTRDEARRALATMPERPATPLEAGGGPLDYELARVRALAGDFAGARRDVESAVTRCDMFDWAELRPRAFFLLGETRERTGDIAGAREAYETVIHKWGRLKPKAVLADRARAKLAALGAR